MGAAGSKITEAEEQSEPLRLPRCQTTLPEEPPVPRQTTLKRRWNDLGDTASTGQGFKRQRFLAAQEASVNAASAPIAAYGPSTERPATASNELAAHPRADRAVRSRVQQAERNLGRHDAESSGFNETLVVTREASIVAQSRRSQVEQGLPSDNVKSTSNTTEVIEVQDSQPNSPVAAADLDDNQHSQGSCALSPQKGPAKSQYLRIRPSRSGSPEREIDETPGLIPAPQPLVSSTERTENRRQIQRAIAALSSSPSELADIQAAATSEDSPTQVRKRRAVQPTEDYVGFVPSNETKKGQQHAFPKSKSAQSHADVRSTDNRASRQAARQRKLGGLWKGWGGSFKEDFE